MPVRLRLFLLFLGLSLVSCRPIAAVPRPVELKPIRVQITPALADWQERLSNCSSVLKESGLIIEKVSVKELDFQNTDLILSLIKPKDSKNKIFSPTNLEIVVVVSPDNPVESITPTDLINIFNGSYENWQDLTGAFPTGKSYDHEIVFLEYSSQHDLSYWVAEVLQENVTLTNKTSLIFNAIMLEQRLSEIPGAIGFALQNESNYELNALALKDEQGEDIDWVIPVTAIMQAEPQGDLRELLLCLQDSLNH